MELRRQVYREYSARSEHLKLIIDYIPTNSDRSTEHRRRKLQNVKYRTEKFMLELGRLIGALDIFIQHGLDIKIQYRVNRCNDLYNQLRYSLWQLKHNCPYFCLYTRRDHYIFCDF